MMFLALLKRLLTAALFALTRWWGLKCKYPSVCVCFPMTVTLRVLSFRANFSKNSMYKLATTAETGELLPLLVELTIEL